MLDRICINIGITYDQFFLVCAKGVKNYSHHKTFEQIVACDNFISFKKLMIRRNKQLEKEALRTLPKLRKRIMQEEKEENEVEKAIKKSLDEAKKIERMKMIEKKEIERALKLSEEEYRRELDLKRRANRKDYEYFSKKNIKEDELQKGMILIAEKTQKVSEGSLNEK